MEFHRQRRMFCVVNGLIHYAPEGYDGSHQQWLLTILPDDTVNQIMKWDLRGYADVTGIYFYSGPDYECSREQEQTAIMMAQSIINTLKLPVIHPVFAGVIPGEEGTRWQARKRLL